LLSAVTNIAADCAAIIPAGMSIEFVESKGVDHNSAAYRERCDWLDQQISKAVLGQTATTDAIAGGHAVGREHREVQQDIKSADCMELQAVLNRDLVRTWIDLEFGPQELYPRLIIEDPDQTDGKALSETLATLIPLGLKVPASWVADKLGIPEPAAGEDVLSAPPPKATVLPAADPAMQSVAGDDVTDRLADQESGEWERMISPVVRQVEDLLASVSNLEEFRAGLAALANRIDTAALAEALGDAGVAMKLAGLMGVPQDVH
jgi:phage gp29-like protein